MFPFFFVLIHARRFQLSPEQNIQHMQLRECTFSVSVNPRRTFTFIFVSRFVSSFFLFFFHFSADCSMSLYRILLYSGDLIEFARDVYLLRGKIERRRWDERKIRKQNARMFPYKIEHFFSGHFYYIIYIVSRHYCLLSAVCCCILKTGFVIGAKTREMCPLWMVTRKC